MQPPVPPASSSPRAVPLGDLLAAGGALLVFAFSFAPFVRYGGEMSQGAEIDGVSPRFNAWSTEIFMVPLTTFIVVAAMLVMAAVGVRFGLRRELSALGFRMRQIEVGLTLFMFVVLLGMIASDKHAFFGARRFSDSDPFLLTQSQMDVGWGAVLMLIGAMIALAGTLLAHFSIGPVIPVGAKPAPPPPPPPPPGTGYGQWQSPPQEPPIWQGNPPPQQQ
jgi:hypothetical protein